MMFPLQLDVNLWQLVDQFLFLVLFPKYRGHLFFQIADDISMNLKRSKTEIKTTVHQHLSSRAPHLDHKKKQESFPKERYYQLLLLELRVYMNS